MGVGEVGGMGLLVVRVFSVLKRTHLPDCIFVVVLRRSKDRPFSKPLFLGVPFKIPKDPTLGESDSWCPSSSVLVPEDVENPRVGSQIPVLRQPPYVHPVKMGNWAPVPGCLLSRPSRDPGKSRHEEKTTNTRCINNLLSPGDTGTKIQTPTWSLSPPSNQE